jgi:hypothetical protein
MLMLNCGDVPIDIESLDNILVEDRGPKCPTPGTETVELVFTVLLILLESKRKFLKKISCYLLLSPILRLGKPI